MKVLRTGLIGAGIGQSRFADALGIMCAQHGLRFEFKAIDTAGRNGFDFADTVDACRANGWTGVSVTHPFKPQAALFAGEAMPSDLRLLGACNTLVFSPTLTGANTDYAGFVDAWKAVFGTLKPGRVALAGAGGVARAIGPALVKLGAVHIDVWDSKAGLARELAARIGPVARAISKDNIAGSIDAADGLVNATPLGMGGHPDSAFPAEQIGGQSWAFDAVYTPVDTTFLVSAHAAGLSVLTGFDLFRFMAMRSFIAFTGLTPDPTHTLAALDSLKPKGELV